MLVLTVVTFYLAANGRINNFPTYLAALAFLPFVVVRPSCFSIFNKPCLLLTVTFLLYLCASAFWSPDTNSLILLKYPGYCFLLLTFTLGIALMSSLYPSFLKWLLVVTILSATIASSYSIFLYYSLPEYRPLIETRLYSIGRLHNPVVGSLSYGIATTLCVNFLLMHAGRIRFLWSSCLFILLLAITLTETRSVWVGLVVSIPVAVLLQESLSTRNKMIILTGSFSFLLLLGLGTWLMGYWDEVLHRATSYRPEIWVAAIQNTLGASLLFGHGIVANSELIIDEIKFQHAHSIYVATFFYSGLVGLGLLLLLITTCFWEIFKVARSPLVILAASSMAYSTVVFLLDGDRLLVKVDFMWIAFWLPVALCLAATLKNGLIEINWGRRINWAQNNNNMNY